MNEFKIIIAVVIFIAGFMFLNEFTGFAAMKIGDTSDVNGQIVEITNIGSDFVKIKIGDKKDIVKEFDEKTINNIKIKVGKIFYVDEAEGRFAEVIIEPVFSNVKAVLEIEEENPNECWKSSDCDDGIADTTDLCTGTPKKCINKIIIECGNDSDCDDSKDETSDKCINNECFNKQIIREDKDKGKDIAPDYEKDTIEEKSIKLKKEKGVLITMIEKIIGWFR